MSYNYRIISLFIVFSLTLNPLGNDLGPKTRSTRLVVPNRTSNIDMSKRLLRADKVLQEQSCCNRTTIRQSQICHVSNFRLELFVVGLFQWHALKSHSQFAVSKEHQNGNIRIVIGRNFNTNVELIDKIHLPMPFPPLLSRRP